MMYSPSLLERFFPTRVPNARPTSSAPLPPAPNAELFERIISLEAAIGGLFQDREEQAKTIVSLLERDRQKDQQIARLEQRAVDLQHHADGLTRALSASSSEVAELRGRLAHSEEGRLHMGQRIGELERTAAELPGLRHELIKAQMTARIWEGDANDLRKRLREAGISAPDAPSIPELKRHEELDTP